MNKKVIIIICLFLQAVFLSAQLLDLTAPLPVDNDFIVGKLENGLTYYIRETNLSKDKADFFIVHNVGSLQEEENQRGLAHFLEHMAFNGTKHFPGKQLINYFESIGVRFGPNVNAYTSPSRTVYNITEVPVTRTTVIDSTLLALHDWSHYISCLPEEIESERGVVLEEIRRSDNPRSRMIYAASKAEQTGSYFVDRATLGLMEVIENFERKELIDFYHKWYRPNEQAVVVVGDIDAKDIERRITERFYAIPNPDNEEDKLYYSVPDNEDPIVKFLIDPDRNSKIVRMTVKIPRRPIAERQTYASLYDDLVESLFLEMFKSRCAESRKKTDAVYSSISPLFGEIDYACKTFTIIATPAIGKDLHITLKGVLKEVERARQHGMTDLELEGAKLIVKSNLQQKQSPTLGRLKNQHLVNFAVDNFTRNQPLVDQSEYFDLAYSMLDKIKIEDVNSNIEKFLNKNNRVIFFATSEKDKESLPTTEEVISLVESIQNRDLEQYTPKPKKELVLSDQIEAGEILVSRKASLEDFGIDNKAVLDSTTELRLQNGARVIWKESYGSGGKVRLSAFAPGGYARSQSIENIIILDNFIRYYNAANLNWNELNEWRNAEGIILRNIIRKTYDSYFGYFPPENSDSFFKLLYSLFTDVSVDKTELHKFKSRWMKTIEEEKNDEKLFQDSIKTLMYSSNPQKANLDTFFIDGLTSEKLNNLYQLHFTNPSEYTFVFTGPMSVDDAKPLIEMYIASIPVNKNLEEIKLISKEPVLKKGEVELYYSAKNTTTSKASVSIIYHTPIEYNTENYVSNLFLKDILSKRFHNSIREDKGGTYHVAVTSSLRRFPSSQLIVNVDFETRPSMITELLDVVQNEVDLLLKEGPTAQEIDEVKKFMMKKLDNSNNVSWIDIITQSLLNEQFVDAEDPELIDQVSIGSVHKLIKALFTSGNKMSFVFDPKTNTVN